MSFEEKYKKAPHVDEGQEEETFSNTNIYKNDKKVNCFNKFGYGLSDFKQSKDRVFKKSQKLLGSRSTPLTSKDILDIVLDELDVVYESTVIDTGKKIDVCYIKNPISGLYDINYDVIFEPLLLQACYGSKSKNTPQTIKNALFEWGIMVKDLDKESYGFRKINKPPTHVILLNNGTYDMKEQRFYPLDDNNPHVDYDFTQRIKHDYIHKDKRNPISNNIIDTLFNNWSGDNEDVKRLLYEFTSATIEGDSKGRCLIINSEGGTGKSSYMKLLELVVGTENTLEMNLHQLNDDNTLNKLSSNVKFVKGDDLKGNFTLGGSSLPTFKILLTNGAVQVSKKYYDNFPVRLNGTMVQATNTPIKTAEATRAFLDRIILLNWCGYNFRENNPNNFELKPILESDLPNYVTIRKELLSTFVSMVLDDIGYVQKFTITDDMKSDAKEMAEDSDKIKQFVEHLEMQGIFHQPTIPNNLAYAEYKIWSKDYNDGGYLVSSTVFNNRFKVELSNKGYVLSKKPKRVRTMINNCLFLESSYSDRSIKSIDLSKNTKYYENTKHYVTVDEMNKFEDLYKSGKITSEYLSEHDGDRIYYVANYLQQTTSNYRDLFVDDY